MTFFSENKVNVQSKRLYIKSIKLYSLITKKKL